MIPWMSTDKKTRDIEIDSYPATKMAMTKKAAIVSPSSKQLFLLGMGSRDCGCSFMLEWEHNSRKECLALICLVQHTVFQCNENQSTL